MATIESNTSNYRYLIVNHPPSADIVCPICLDILVEPYQLTCCGQHLCKGCGQEITEVCPLCRANRYQMMPDKYFERTTINCLQVYCKEKDKGCPMKGDLHRILAHMKDCEYKDIECPLKCRRSYQRRLIKAHMSNDCHNRPYKCKYCGHSSTYMVITYGHTPTCAKAPVMCPNKCDPQMMITRDGLSEHMKKHCPLQMVSCEFDICHMDIARQDLPKHLKDYAHHHTALMTKKLNDEMWKALSAKNKEASKKDKKFIAMLREKDEQIKEKDQQMKEKDEQLKLLEQRLDLVLMCSNNFFELKGFSTKQGHWFSLPYYTYGGYKMCFDVDIDNCKDVDINEDLYYEGHLCIRHYIMRGPFDDTLQWPFEGKVIVRIIDQSGDNHHFDYEFDYSEADDGQGDRVIDYSGNDRGLPYTPTSEQLPASDLPDYLVDDVLQFSITS